MRWTIPPHARRRSAALGLAIALAAVGVGPARAADPETERLLARVAIEDLIAEYTYHHDRREADQIRPLFTEDVVIRVVGAETAVGREAAMRRFMNRPPERFTRHVTTNLRLAFRDADHAEGVRMMIYYAADPQTDRRLTAPRGVTEYAESFVRGGDGKWRISSRVITPLFGER